MKNLKKKFMMTVLTIAAIAAMTGCGKKNDEAVDASNGEETTDISSEQNADTSSDEAADTSDKEAASAQEDYKELRIGTPGTDISNALVLTKVAINQGYLEEELNAIGYTASVSAFTKAGPEINEALMSDALDIAIYGDLPAINNNDKGTPTTIIAADCAKWKNSFLVADGVEIHEPSDFEGLNVVVPMGTVSQYVWDEFAKANNLDAGKINIINSTDGVTLIATNDADVTISPGPTAYYNEENGIGHVYEMPQQDIFSSFVVCVRTDVLESDPRIGVAFNKALIKAYEDVEKDHNILYDALETPDISKEIYTKVFGYADSDPSVYNPEIGEDLRTHLDSLNQWMVDNGVLENQFDLDTIIDTQYYEDAKNELSGSAS